MKKPNLSYNQLLFLSCLFIFACGDSKKQEEKDTTEISALSLNAEKLVNGTTQTKHEFKTVIIDGKAWAIENLNAVTFNNGDTIKEAKTSEEWMEAGKNNLAVWCYYDNAETNSGKLGKLYNWHAVTDSRGLAPKGFKIPSEADVIGLIKSQGGKTAAEKLKSTSGWPNNKNGNNQSGLNVLPSGLRSYNGAFNNSDNFAYFWSKTSNRGSNAWHLVLNNNISITKIYSSSKSNGFSVRCIKE